MDCEVFESGSAICGNFATLQDSKPEPFDYDRTAKWLEPYPFDKREVIGGTVCNCKTVEIHYAPYYGCDFFHLDSCYLMQKYRNTSNPDYFWSMQYLPAIQFGDNAVPADTPPRAYIKSYSRAVKIKVRTSPIKDLRQAALF